MSRDTGVVIAAAGMGVRFGDRKQFLVLADRPLLHYSLDAFAAVADIAEIVVVLCAEDLAAGEEVVRSWGVRRDPPVRVTTGGARRQDSVRHGIDALESSRYVLVHDAARPLVLASDIENVLAEVRRSGAAVIGFESPDSLKWVVDGGIVEEIDRRRVWSVQTPQGAEIELLRRAYAAVGDTEWTDEASLLRAAGVRVTPVPGSRGNIKITRPGDELLVEAILRGRGL
jgi:2-C-methyl-D-erythritol 4-phosphate cytidylyltransferase